MSKVIDINNSLNFINDYNNSGTNSNSRITATQLGELIFYSTSSSINSSSGTIKLLNGGLSINSTVNSSNSSVGGACTIAGGLAIGKDIYIKGLLQGTTINSSVLSLNTPSIGAAVDVLNLNNGNLLGANSIRISDPGANNEGLFFDGGNLWQIAEATNALTNSSGNLQIILNGTRNATFETSGNLFVREQISSNSLLTSFLTSANIISTDTSITNITVTSLRAQGMLSGTVRATGSITTPSIFISSGSLNATFNSNTIGSIFTTGGNVGINNTNPGYTLDISGTLFVNSGTNNSILSANTSNDVLQIKNIDNSGNSTLQYLDSSNTQKLYIGYGNTSANVNYAGIGYILSSSGVPIKIIAGNNTGSYISINASDNSMSITTTTESIDTSSGSIKISGGASIVKTLNVGGGITTSNINFTGSLYQNGSLYTNSQWTSLSNGSIFYTSGNIGINSTNPLYKLDIFDNTSSVTQQRIYNSNTSGGRAGLFLQCGNTNGGIVMQHDSYNFIMETLNTSENILLYNYGSFIVHDKNNGNAERFRIVSSSGNVGINNNNPLVALDVIGSSVISVGITSGSVSATNVSSTNIQGTNISTSSLRVSSTATIATVSATTVVSSALNNSGTATIQNLLSANITTGSLFANTGITTGTLLATSSISTGQLQTINITTSTLRASTGITTGTLLATSSISTGQLQTTNITTSTLIANTGITTGTLLATSSISTGQLQTINITTSTLRASTGITTGTLLATSSISTGQLQTTNITTSTLIASTGITTDTLFATNITTNTLNCNGTDGSVLWTFNTDRPWQFKQSGTGAIADLHLKSTINAKRFKITDLNNNPAVDFYLVTSGNQTTFYGMLSITDTTESTNITDGAVVIDGGVGIAKNLNIGGITSSANVKATNISTSSLRVSSTATIQNLLSANITTGSLFANTGITTSTLRASTGITTGTLLATSSITTNTLLANGLISGSTINSSVLNLNTPFIGPVDVLNLNNGNLLGANSIHIVDPGVNNEGLFFDGGNLWQIAEATNTLTNTSGNLQIILNGTRNATFETSGNFYISGEISSNSLLTSFLTSANMLSGTFRATGSITTPSIFISSGSLNATFNSNTIGSIITTGGNIGINNTNPGYKLDIFDNTTSSIQQRIYNTNTSGRAGIFLQNNNIGGFSLQHAGTDALLEIQDTVGNIVLYNYGNFSILDKNNGFAERFTIVSSSGNVGISNNNPLYKLDISGTQLITSSQSIGNTNPGTVSGGALNVSTDIVCGNSLVVKTGNVAAPTFTTRSLGTKINLYPSLSASALDYAIGVEANHTWFSAPTFSGFGFKWYQGINNTMTLATYGNLFIYSTADSTNVSNGALVINGGVSIAKKLTVGATTLSSDFGTGDTNLELGGNRTSDGNCFIDFHSSSSVDYDFRIIRFPGVNGALSMFQNGTSEISITSPGGIVINTTKNSTSITDGALIVNGGVGIAKNLNVGGTIVSNESVRALGTITTVTQGYHRIEMGVANNSPRILFEHTTGHTFVNSNTSGALRWSLANGTHLLTMFSNGNLSMGSINTSTALATNITTSTLLATSTIKTNEHIISKNSFAIKSYMTVGYNTTTTIQYSMTGVPSITGNATISNLSYNDLHRLDINSIYTCTIVGLNTNANKISNYLSNVYTSNSNTGITNTTISNLSATFANGYSTTIGNTTSAAWGVAATPTLTVTIQNSNSNGSSTLTDNFIVTFVKLGSQDF